MGSGRRSGTITVLCAVALACSAAAVLVGTGRPPPEAILGVPPHPGAVGEIAASAPPPEGPAGILPPANPSANLVPTPTVQQAIDTECWSPGGDPNGSACIGSMLEAIDAAHAAEGIPPMVLPTNWYALSAPEQLFVVVDLERTERGLPPYVGLAAPLDAADQSAAAAAADPVYETAFGSIQTAGFGGVWAGGAEVSGGAVLQADDAWMYQDGWGGAGATENEACTSPGAAGCWAHRDQILGYDPAFGYTPPPQGTATGLECTTCVVGAGAVDRTASAFPGSLAVSFVRPQNGIPPLVFTWADGVVPYLGNGITAADAAFDPQTFVAMAATPDGGGYWLAAAAGGVVPYGNAVNYGSMAGVALDAPIGHIVPTPDGKGYWLVAADGGVFAFGDAVFYGSMGGHRLNAPVVDLVPTPDGKGYWLVASDGGVFAFGDAVFYGSMGGERLNAPINGIAASPGGRGYWLVASDGGVFAFGDAAFYGSMGGLPLGAPVVGMAASPGGRGYWLVASDGGVFAFGDAAFHGSMGGAVLDTPMVGMAADPATGGYWTVASDGGVFAFDAPFHGAASPAA